MMYLLPEGELPEIKEITRDHNLYLLFSKIEARLILENIIDKAQSIESNNESVLLPYPKGIYFNNHDISYIPENKKLYTSDGSMITINDITENNDIKEVFDKDGNTLINTFILKNKKLFLSNTPKIPSRGLNILLALISQHVYTMLHSQKYSPYSTLKKILNKEGIEKFEDGEFDEILDPYIDRLNDFVTNFRWNVHYVNIKGVDIFIERSIDYRIFLYYKRVIDERAISETENEDDFYVSVKNGASLKNLLKI